MTVAEASPPAVNSRLAYDEEAERVLEPGDPTAHLSAEQVNAIGHELDALREEILADRGANDAAYIRRVIKVQRTLEMTSRVLLLFSGRRAIWLLGTTGLTVAKILENMEIGHNTMHGQWDWMRDPKIHSRSWEWDNVSPASHWKHAHNEIHHTFTNVLGRDNDLGYGILRVDEGQRWSLFFLGQPLWHLINAAIFEYSIAAYDLELGAYMHRRKRLSEEEKADFRFRAREVLVKIRRQFTKDYLVHPALSGPNWKSTMKATATANFIRNIWTNTVIMCGHFPEGIETFEKNSIDGETRGEWYLRQMIGSGNITGSKAMHIMTGNLSHQIEHHCFPDMPSNRYAEIAPRIRELMDRYNLNYQSGPLYRQIGSVYKKLLRLSLPNPEPDRSRGQIVAAELKKVARRKLRFGKRSR